MKQKRQPNKGSFQKGHKINVGRKMPHSAEHNKKISEYVKSHPVSFWKGKKMSEEHKNKLSISHRGLRRTEEQRKKMSEQSKKNGRVPPLMNGSNNPAWKGGVSGGYKKKNAPRPKPNQCEVCGSFGSDTKHGLCFDHDHKTGKFRGWICGRCNFALGMVKDNRETLYALIEYLNKNHE